MPRRMDRCSGSAPPAQESGTSGAAGSVAARENNVSGPQKASKMMEAQETNVSGLQETSEMSGARETNMPEEESSTAAKREAEPQVSAAQAGRQKETAAGIHQAAAGERGLPPRGEDGASGTAGDGSPGRIRQPC
jgi:hypothetical protein